jgi:Ca2+-binding RTX toxin-like protein
LAAAFVVLPASARADTATCSYNAGNRTATVNVTPGAHTATGVFFRADGPLYLYVVSGSPSGVCGSATNTNTDTIVVNNASPAQPLTSIFYLSFFSGIRPYGPGATNEAGLSDEIEMVFNFGAGGTLGFQSWKSTGDPGLPLNLAFGGNQGNLNAAEADGIDPDITMNGVSRLLIYGSDGTDVIGGSGGPGVPSQPVGSAMEVNANSTPDTVPSSDVITGGSAADRILGSSSADLIAGGDGEDSVSAGAGDDLIAGGDGKDSVSAGAGDDLIFGGPAKDLLQGEAGSDRIAGGNKNDRLFGGLDPDFLNGGAGRKDRCSKSKQDHRKKCEILVPG